MVSNKRHELNPECVGWLRASGQMSMEMKTQDIIISLLVDVVTVCETTLLMFVVLVGFHVRTSR